VAWAVLWCLTMPAAGQGAVSAPPVAPEDGEVAYYLVDGWVRAGEVPEDASLPRAPLTGVFGVYVTLRDDGQLVGSGSALREDLTDAIDTPGPPVDMAVLLAEATRTALRDLEQTQRRRAIELGISDPDLLAQRVRDVHARLQIDVQVGHKLESVVLPADGTGDAVYAQFVPGFHGLRLTGPLMPDGDLVWPANALARNTSPRSQLVQLLDRQGFEEEDLAVVARPSGPQLERFEVIHFVQANASMPPRQLIRGNVPTPRRALDTAALHGITERIARHLDGKLEVLNDGTRVMRGPYLPSPDRVSPDLASPRQASLACFAMMVQSRSAQERTPGDRISRVRAERALSLVETLAEVVNPANGEPRPISVALLLLALTESPVPVDADLRDALAEVLLGLRLEDGGFRAAVGDGGSRGGDAGDEGRVDPAIEAVITAALASWCVAAQPDDPAISEWVWDTMSQLAEASAADPKGAQIAVLTWLSVAYSRAGTQLAGQSSDPIALDRLGRMQAFFADQLQFLSDQQVRGVPLIGPADVTGGYVTRTGPAGAAPDPSWESSMPLAIVAVTVRDDAIVAPDAIFGPLLSAQLGAGFVSKLLLVEQNGYYVRDRNAIGGVRRSLWDNTLDLDCSSMALIALSEMQTTLHRLDQRDAPE
jgi:hypothetical protein